MGTPGTARRDDAPLRLWRMCTAIDGSHAEAYLHARAIRACRDPALRFHPALYYRGPDGRFATFPALVARVSGPDGAFTGIQRTYLHPRHPAKDYASYCTSAMWSATYSGVRGRCFRAPDVWSAGVRESQIGNGPARYRRVHAEARTCAIC